jgi:glycosyltransferase involved in cell wall biosynthesis
VKVSIVTISYNQAEFLERAIRSIIKQDYDYLEYIVVDPGSTDGSRDIIERYRSKITKVIYEKDSGPADGLNKGFSYATGDVFGFINADDELLPGSLQMVSNYFNKKQDIDVVCGSGYIIDADDRKIKKLLPTCFTSRLYAYGAVTFLQQSTFFRKKAFLVTEGFNKDNRSCWDGELLCDMAMHHQKFGILYEDFALFRIHESSISGSGRMNEVYMKDSNLIFRKVVGRGKNSLDKLLAIIYLLEKWIMNPRVTIFRIFTYLGLN